MEVLKVRHQVDDSAPSAFASQYLPDAFTIEKVLSDVNFIIKNKVTGKEMVTHHDHLKPYIPETAPRRPQRNAAQPARLQDYEMD